MLHGAGFASQLKSVISHTDPEMNLGQVRMLPARDLIECHSHRSRL